MNDNPTKDTWNVILQFSNSTNFGPQNITIVYDCQTITDGPVQKANESLYKFAPKKTLTTSSRKDFKQLPKDNNNSCKYPTNSLQVIPYTQ